MADLGLLAGLAQGLQQGLGSYIDTKRSLEQDALKKRMQGYDEALKKAQIVDLLGTEGAQQALSGIDAGPGLVSNESQSPGLMGPSMGKRDRDLLNQATMAKYAKDPTGLTPVAEHGVITLKQTPLSAEEQMKRDKEELDLKLKKKQLSKETEENEALKPNQAQAANFGHRMDQAESVFQELQQKGFNRADPSMSAQAGFLNVLPGGESFKPEDLKRQEQAERNFVNAVLRRESGAAISKSEFDSAEKQYFPRAGDPDSVLQQKALNRQQAIQSMKAEAGPKAWGKTSIGSQGLVKKSVQKTDQKLKVSNGKEILLIDPSDLSSAQKDGYSVVR